MANLEDFLTKAELLEEEVKRMKVEAAGMTSAEEVKERLEIFGGVLYRFFDEAAQARIDPGDALLRPTLLRVGVLMEEAQDFYQRLTSPLH